MAARAVNRALLWQLAWQTPISIFSVLYVEAVANKSSKKLLLFSAFALAMVIGGIFGYTTNLEDKAKKVAIKSKFLKHQDAIKHAAAKNKGRKHSSPKTQETE